MAISRVKTWIAGEVLTASDLNAEFNNIINNALSLISPLTGNLDADGNSIILDADADSSITADTDDQIDFAVGGTDRVQIIDGTKKLALTGIAIDGAKGSDIASSGTTDIGAATGNYVDVTGTTTITALGTVQAGTIRKVQFDGSLTLTHNGTSLILPGASDINTTAGDVGEFVSLGSGNWKLIGWQSGSSLGGAVGTFDFTDTSDVSIASVVPTGTLWSSSQTITIPTSGFIMLVPNVRIDNASGATRNYYVGLRIDGTDHWANVDINGSASYITVGQVSNSTYRTLRGGYSASGFFTHTPGLDIEGSSISTGSQTVQPVVAAENSTATQTLKGATTTARLKVVTFDMS